MKNILKNAENAERLLKLTSDTMIILDKDGVCVDIAVNGESLWFLKEEMLLGRNLLQLMPNTTYQEFYPEFQKVLTQQVRSVRNFEITLKRQLTSLNASCTRMMIWYFANTVTLRNVANKSWN